MPPPVQDRADARQHPFRGGERRRVLQRDGVAALQQLTRRIRRRVEFHVLAEPSSDWSGRSPRVVFDGSFRSGLDVQRQRGDPVLQLDLAHAADEHVGDPDPAVDVERQRIRHLDVDRHLVRAGAGPPGNGTFAMPCHPQDVSTTAIIASAETRLASRPTRSRVIARVRSSRKLIGPATCLSGQRRARRRGAGARRRPCRGCEAPTGSPGITSGAGAGGGPGCGYHGGGSGLFWS